VRIFSKKAGFDRENGTESSTAQREYRHDDKELDLPSRDTADRVSDGISGELHGEDGDEDL
jgi:hypothetical protein